MRPRTVGGGTRSPALGPTTPTPNATTASGGGTPLSRTRDPSPAAAALQSIPAGASKPQPKRGAFSVTTTSAKAKTAAAMQRQNDAGSSSGAGGQGFAHARRGGSPPPQQLAKVGSGSYGSGGGSFSSPAPPAATLSVAELSAAANADVMRASEGISAIYRAPLLRAPGIAPQVVASPGSAPPRLVRSSPTALAASGQTSSRTSSSGSIAAPSAATSADDGYKGTPSSVQKAADAWWGLAPLEVRASFEKAPALFQVVRFCAPEATTNEASSQPDDTALPWRRPCDIPALLSRETAAQPSPPPSQQQQQRSPGASLVLWQSEWFGSQLRRGGTGSSSSTSATAGAHASTSGSESATGVATSGQGGIVRADHVHLAQTLLSAGRPCDALSTLYALAQLDPAFGKGERQLLFDAATEFLNKKRKAVDSALRTCVAQFEAIGHTATAAAPSSAPNSSRHSSTVASRSASACDSAAMPSSFQRESSEHLPPAGVRESSPSPARAPSGILAAKAQLASSLLLDVAVPDLMLTTARLLRLILSVLIPGAVAPGRSTLVATLLYSKWAADFVLDAATIAFRTSRQLASAKQSSLGGGKPHPGADVGSADDDTEAVMLAPVIAALLNAEVDVLGRCTDAAMRCRPTLPLSSGADASAAHLATTNISAHATLTIGVPIAGRLVRGLHQGPLREGGGAPASDGASMMPLSGSGSVQFDAASLPIAAAPVHAATSTAAVLICNCVVAFEDLYASSEVLLSADHPMRIALAVGSTAASKNAVATLGPRDALSSAVANTAQLAVCEAAAAAATMRLDALLFELECLEAHQAEATAAAAAATAPSKDGKPAGSAGSSASDLSASTSSAPKPNTAAGIAATAPPVKVPTHSRGAKIQANVLRELVAGASVAAAKEIAHAAALSVSAKDE